MRAFPFPLSDFLAGSYSRVRVRARARHFGTGLELRHAAAVDLQSFWNGPVSFESLRRASLLAQFGTFLELA